MTSAPTTAFPHFLDLPFEIRWAIYELCLPTRVVDSGIVPELILPGRYYFIAFRELKPALRYIVGKYSRTPAISRAVPEVYRKLRHHVVPPPANRTVWDWTFSSDYPEEHYHDPRPIFFDPKSDILYISPRDHGILELIQDPKLIERTPYCLAKSPDVVVAVDGWSLEILDRTPSIANYCFLGRKNCTIILSETRLIKPMESIISCGLFGLWGEGRTILVDVDDFELIDYYDRKLNGQDIHPRPWKDNFVISGGIRRYSSHGTVDFRRPWDEDSPVVSAEERAQLIARDKEEMLRRVKVVWLGVSGCWDRPSRENPNFVPHESCPDLPPDWNLVFDEGHPTAKLWLDKLPAFSFAVRVHAQDLEECKRMWGAQLAADEEFE